MSKKIKIREAFNADTKSCNRNISAFSNNKEVNIFLSGLVMGRSLGSEQNDIFTADLKELLSVQNRIQEDLLGTGGGGLCGCRILGLERLWYKC